MIPASFAVSAPYRALHAYLHGRYADTVVLTFGEIEDLLGWPLPDAARTQPEWWKNETAAGVPTPQSRAWTQANRTATLHLFARTVVFDRLPD